MKLLLDYMKFALLVSLLGLHTTAIFAQQCSLHSAEPLATPSIDFTVNNDGTVIHETTGLMWKVCSEGQAWSPADGACAGDASLLNWQQALQAADTLNVGGGFANYKNWRLPNIKELLSIRELQCAKPAINLEIFNNTPESGTYWSSSPGTVGLTYRGEGALVVGGPQYVQAFPRSYTGAHVRLVRDVD